MIESMPPNFCINGKDTKTLNDKEFEELVKDLLQIELGVRLQSFKSGKDGGIDLRYSTSKDNAIIVQVKHYLKSGYSQLKSSLKKALRL